MAMDCVMIWVGNDLAPDLTDLPVDVLRVIHDFCQWCVDHGEYPEERDSFICGSLEQTTALLEK